jgi:transposase
MLGVIRLFVEGVKPLKIIRRMQAQYGDNYLSRSKIYEWIDHFRKRRTSVWDEERSGRPLASRTENNIEAVERIIRENRRITVDDTVDASICLAQWKKL